MHLPKPRGAFSERVLATLASGDVATLGALPEPESAEDAALVLWCLYELSYRGFQDVDDRLEWAPELIAVRRDLEEDLEARLRSRWSGQPAYDGDFATAFFAEVEGHEGPSLARFVQRSATADQGMELLQARSIYHLKESDPVAFSVPRLPVAPRAALMELQYDEYGGGRPDRLHQALFARGLEACGLSAEYGAYLDLVPGATLAVSNIMNLFVLHRSLAAAAMGHLGAFEATSSQPCRRVAQGCRRLGLSDVVSGYFDEHIEADAVHEQLAFRDICGGLAAESPELEEDLFLGAAAYLHSEALAGQAMLAAWRAGRSSMREAEGGPDIRPRVEVDLESPVAS